MSNGASSEPLSRITVTVDAATARAIAHDAAARGLTRPEVIRQAVAFDLSARLQASAALAGAVEARALAAQRLAQLLGSRPAVGLRRTPA